jgi:hypothetical protein
MKRFYIGHLNYFQMHLGFLIIFKIINAHANSFVLEQVRPDIEPLLVRTSILIFVTLELTIFRLFRLIFLADCLCVVHALRLFGIYISHVVT